MNLVDSSSNTALVASSLDTVFCNTPFSSTNYLFFLISSSPSFTRSACQSEPLCTAHVAHPSTTPISSVPLFYRSRHLYTNRHYLQTTAPSHLTPGDQELLLHYRLTNRKQRLLQHELCHLDSFCIPQYSTRPLAWSEHIGIALHHKVTTNRKPLHILRRIEPASQRKPRRCVNQRATEATLFDVT